MTIFPTTYWDGDTWSVSRVGIFAAGGFGASWFAAGVFAVGMFDDGPSGAEGFAAGVCPRAFSSRKNEISVHMHFRQFFMVIKWKASRSLGQMFR
jgi:hypothetical protein